MKSPNPKIFPQGMLTKPYSILVLVVVCFFVGNAYAEEASNFGGNWIGTCPDCTGTDFRLMLEQVESTATGSLQVTGTTSFGNDVNTFEDGKINGRKLKFKVKVESGTMFYVSLKINKEETKLTGSGRKSGYTYSLSFKRAEE